MRQNVTSGLACTELNPGTLALRVVMVWVFRLQSYMLLILPPQYLPTPLTSSYTRAEEWIVHINTLEIDER